ncbi:PAS domain-containing hybrid sensor histidine kinase/response regulator [Algivirga pacifica]|uniref:histidine kinase n=1 Tax=Algivirga pacifica TaxID=1162670 RepID=A0ABP9DDZ8_9BACT
MLTVQQRIEDICTLIFEVANGNFDYRIDSTDDDDELNAIIQGVNMLGEELKTSTVSRDFMQSIYKGVIDMLFILNKDLSIRSMNEVACQILQYKEEELKAANIAELLCDPQGELIKYVQAEIAEKGEAHIETCFTTKDRREIPTSINFSQLINNQNEVDGILIIARDITEQKEAERQLILAKEKADAASEAKSRFLFNMSHEIRTPLNGILGFTELLKFTETDETQDEYLELILNAGKNLNRLLNDILDLNKIEQDKLVFEKKNFSIRENITFCLKPYKFLAEEKELTFSFHIDNSVPEYVISDPTRLNQIIINLTNNAIKFTENGSIDVSFTARRLSSSKMVLRGEVTDSGIGIPLEKQALIFESFTQSDESTTRLYGGSGLGLSICKKLTQLMHGDIGIISPPVHQAQGSTFWFEIEMEYTTQSPVVERFELDVSKFKFKEEYNILVVDDSDINLLRAKVTLEHLGAEVTIVNNGKEAIQLVKEADYDLIFMDIQMPVMDGYHAAEVIREEGYDKVIIALSANASRDCIDKCNEKGMNDYLMKPYESVELLNMILKHL